MGKFPPTGPRSFLHPWNAPDECTLDPIRRPLLLTLTHELQLGEFYLDGVRLTNEDANLSTNPDATLVRRTSLRAGRVRLLPRQSAHGQFLEIECTPDWVMEVVSNSSVRKDTEELRAAYHRAGIPEYWLIDARGGELDFRILHRHKRAYVDAPNQEGWRKSRVFGRWFRLERRRDDLGLWEYTLHIRAEPAKHDPPPPQVS